MSGTELEAYKNFFWICDWFIRFWFIHFSMLYILVTYEFINSLWTYVCAGTYIFILFGHCLAVKLILLVVLGLIFNSNIEEAFLPINSNLFNYHTNFIKNVRYYFY